MKHRIAILLLALTLGLPIVAIAQDTPTDVPAFETATIEAFTPVPTEAPTIEPTLAPTETPVPVPPPIDQTKVFEGAYSTIIALVAAVVLIAFAGIVAAFLALPPWLRPIFLGIAKNALDAGDKVAATTPTKIDDIGMAELRELYLRLEAKQNETQAQVNSVAVKVEANAQAVQAVARSQNS